MTVKLLDGGKPEAGRMFLRRSDKHPVAVTIAFWVLYLLVFSLIEHLPRSRHLILHARLDDMIPFVKYAAPFYYIWFAALAVTYAVFLFRGSRKMYWKLYVSMALCTFTTLIFYLLVPNGVDLRPASVQGNDVFAWMMRMIWMADNSYNVCPSLHVSTSVLMDLLWQRSGLLRKNWQKAAVRVIDILIILSTMFLKQHSVIDVITGLFYGILTCEAGSRLAEACYEQA